jgi:NTE family protein
MKKQTALVLGTGGARGLAHIGVIKALEENKIPIDIITGTSIGAFIGGLYASGMDVAAMEKIVDGTSKMMVAKIFRPKLFAPGFVGNESVMKFIKSLVGNVKIENLDIPFAASATDLITGEEVVFTKGSLADAIMASIAIPTVFQPVNLGGRYLLDGGLCNPLPISIALELKARNVIAVNVSPNPKRITEKIKKTKTNEIKSLAKKLPNYLSALMNENIQQLLGISNKTEEKGTEEIDTFSPKMMQVFLQSISITTNNLMAQRLRYAKPDILICPKIEAYDMLEFYKGNEIIKCGYDETIKSISKIRSAAGK